jgi:hypothetical protein
MTLTEREIEVINCMIETNVYHAQQCQLIIDCPGEGGNVLLATHQWRWDMERVELLLKIKQHFGVAE